MMIHDCRSPANWDLPVAAAAVVVVVVDLDEAAVVGGFGVYEQGRDVVQIAGGHELTRVVQSVGLVVVPAAAAAVQVDPRHPVGEEFVGPEPETVVTV